MPDSVEIIDLVSFEELPEQEQIKEVDLGEVSSDNEPVQPEKKTFSSRSRKLNDSVSSIQPKQHQPFTGASHKRQQHPKTKPKELSIAADTSSSNPFGSILENHIPSRSNKRRPSEFNDFLMNKKNKVKKNDSLKSTQKDGLAAYSCAKLIDNGIRKDLYNCDNNDDYNLPPDVPSTNRPKCDLSRLFVNDSSSDFDKTNNNSSPSIEPTFTSNSKSYGSRFSSKLHVKDSTCSHISNDRRRAFSTESKGFLSTTRPVMPPSSPNLAAVFSSPLKSTNNSFVSSTPKLDMKKVTATTKMTDAVEDCISSTSYSSPIKNTSKPKTTRKLHSSTLSPDISTNAHKKSSKTDNAPRLDDIEVFTIDSESEGDKTCSSPSSKKSKPSYAIVQEIDFNDHSDDDLSDLDNIQKTTANNLLSNGGPSLHTKRNNSRSHSPFTTASSHANNNTNLGSQRFNFGHQPLNFDDLDKDDDDDDDDVVLESNIFKLKNTTNTTHKHQHDNAASFILNSIHKKSKPTEDDEIICLDDNEDSIRPPQSPEIPSRLTQFSSWKDRNSNKVTNLHKDDDNSVEVLDSSPAKTKHSTNHTKNHTGFHNSTIDFTDDFNIDQNGAGATIHAVIERSKESKSKRMFASLESTGFLSSSSDDDDGIKIISKSSHPVQKTSTGGSKKLSSNVDVDATARSRKAKSGEGNSGRLDDDDFSSIQYSSVFNGSDSDDDGFKIISGGGSGTVSAKRSTNGSSTSRATSTASKTCKNGSSRAGSTSTTLHANIKSSTTGKSSVVRDSNTRSNTDPSRRRSNSCTPPPTAVHPVSSPSGGMNVSFSNGDSDEIRVDQDKEYTEEELDNMLAAAKLANAAALKKVNQARRDKEEFMADIKLVINDKLLKSFEIINPNFATFFKPIVVESTPITFNYPIIQFKRSIDCIYHPVKHTFIPIEQSYYKYEKFIGIWFEASELLAQLDNLKELIKKIKAKDEDFIIIVFLNGYDTYMRSLDTQVNRVFQRRLQSQTTTTATTTRKRKTTNDNDRVISPKQLELQLIELEIQTGIHQFPIKGLKDLIEWLKSLSYTISTKFRDPKHRLDFSNMGGIKSHNDSRDIMKESLSQIRCITDRNSKNVVEQYNGSLNSLFHGLANGDSSVNGIRSDAFKSMKLLFLADDEDQLIHL